VVSISNGDISNIAHKQFILTRYYSSTDQIAVKPLPSIGSPLVVAFARDPKTVVQQHLFGTVTAKSTRLDLIKNLPTAHFFMIHSDLSGHFNDRTFLFQ
jgi:hypothetical protein